MAFFSGGISVNPIIGTVLADSGPAPTDCGGVVFVAISASAALNANFELRNATNDTTIIAHSLFLSALSPFMAPFNVQLQAGQRMRIVTTLALLGSADGSMSTDFI